MTTPPLLLAGALLFWGYQTNLLLWAALMGLILEGSRVVRARWEFSDTDLNRIWDLSGLLFLGAMVVLYTSEETTRTAFIFAQWQPFIFFPVALAQAYGNREQMPLSSLSWLLRRAKDSSLARKGINISFLYFGVCLLGASATNINRDWFFPIIAVLVAWSLWAVRPRTIAAPVWMVVVGIVLAGGYVGHIGLRELHSRAEVALGQWLLSLWRREMNPKESRTAIGQIGKLKLSGRIVLRVAPEGGNLAPTHLREASYDYYKGGIWSASLQDYSTVSFDTNDTVHFLEPKEKPHAVRIAGYLRNGKGFLALPHGTFEAHNLPVAMETNSLGVAKINEGPALVNFVAYYGPGQSMDAPPTKLDTEVSEREQEVMTQIADELGLASMSDEDKLQAISKYFQDNFTYSMELLGSDRSVLGKYTPLGDFLTTTRAGHCEYFATATVLLLRQAGIPARYATGFGVSETSGKSYVVRERHAHAWTRVYMNGAWFDFDTTPASWSKHEAENASMFEPVSDLFQWMGFQFSKWRWSKTTYTKYLVWLLIPLVLFLAWRIIFNKNRKRAGNNRDGQTLSYNWPGLDSEFYEVEKRLAEAGLVRAEHEPAAIWARRVKNSKLCPTDQLDTLLSLHEQYRFDPNGLNAGERSSLSNAARAVLNDLRRSADPSRN